MNFKYLIRMRNKIETLNLYANTTNSNKKQSEIRYRDEKKNQNIN